MLVKVSVMPQSPVSPLVLHSLTEDVEDCEYCVPAGRRAVFDFGLSRLSCQPGMMECGYILSLAIDMRLELQVAADNPFGDCDCEGQVSSSLNTALIPLHFFKRNFPALRRRVLPALLRLHLRRRGRK